MGTLEKMFEMIDEEEAAKNPAPPTPQAETDQAPDPSDLDRRASQEEELEPPKPPPEDPFGQMVDSMLRESGVDVDREIRRPYNPASGDVTNHDWEMGREALFGGEAYQFKCKRCFHYLEVDRDKTIKQALEEKGVDPNCSRLVISDVSAM